MTKTMTTLEHTTQNIFQPDKPKNRILVVDDEEGFRMLMKACLSDKYDTTIVESAHEAERVLNKKYFDIALFDIHMPNISGKELFTKCSDAYPNMPIILMSGKPIFDDAVQTIKQGAYDYLAKPFEITTLVEKIESAIRYQKEYNEQNEGIKKMSPELLARKKFKIISSLGAGNSGVVLLVEKDSIKYAMKILRYSGNASKLRLRVRRFLREGKILTKMDHPNVIKVFKYGLIDDKEIPYMLLEYCKGKNLFEYLSTNVVTLDEKYKIIEDIASGLNHIHSSGIIHRDIKPQNVIVPTDGDIKITDFGIAKDKNSMLTMTSDVMGTPSYMSPESFSSSKDIDHRTDIFSLGSLSYEILTGQRPFEADTVFGVMEMIRNYLPPKPSSINREIKPWMDMLVMWMLEKKSDARPFDCAEIIKIFHNQTINN